MLMYHGVGFAFVPVKFYCINALLYLIVTLSSWRKVIRGCKVWFWAQSAVGSKL